MTQLSAALARTYELGDQTDHAVKQSAAIYEGSAVGLTAGYARQLTAGDTFLGFAMEDVAAPSADGGATVRVLQKGKVVLTISSIAVTDIGKIVYASDGNAFTLTESTNSPIGRVVRVNATNQAVVAFDATRGGLGDVTQLTDSSGGTAADTLVAISGTFSQSEIRNNFASLADRVNRVAKILGAS